MSPASTLVTPGRAWIWLLPLALALGCGAEPEETFELGPGEFAWSALSIGVTTDLEGLEEPVDNPQGTWRPEVSLSNCELSGLIYGIGSMVPCEGEVTVSFGDCAPDPNIADAELCSVTLGELALTLRPAEETPVVDGATVRLTAPVTAEESWSWGILGGGLSRTTGSLTVTGRQGGASTRYDVSMLEVTIDYANANAYLRLRAEKPGW